MLLRDLRPPLFLLVLIAIIAGVVFFLVDNAQQGTGETALPTLAASVAEASSESVNINSAEGEEVIAPLVDTNREVVTILPNTRLFVPSMSINAPIIHVFLSQGSWDISLLGNNVGHLQGTGWLDNGGKNIVLSGHVELSDGRKGIFAGLENLEVGALVAIQTDTETWLYTVREINKTTADDLSPIYPTDKDQLTLITCGSYDFFSNEYLERIVVVADRIG